MLLYASQFDDVPLVVNISGRFDMKRGITERFGPDVFEKLDKFNEVEMMQRRENGQGQFKWILTKRVSQVLIKPPTNRCQSLMQLMSLIARSFCCICE